MPSIGLAEILVIGAVGALCILPIAAGMVILTLLLIRRGREEQSGAHY